MTTLARPSDGDLSPAAAAWRHVYAQRWAAGLCVDCGTARPAGNRTLCQACGVLRSIHPTRTEGLRP
jgi:hypothetical protein